MLVTSDLLKEDPLAGVGSQSSDLLGHDIYGSRLATFLLEDVSPGTMLALWGGWGSGKTRILHYLGQHLLAEAGAVSVHFNPWESGGDLDTVVRGMRDSLIDRACESLGETELGVQIQAALKAALKTHGFVREGASFLRILNSAVKKLGRDYLGEEAETLLQDMGLTPPDKSQAQRALWEAVVETTKRALEANATEGRIVVLVDDLDRCERALQREFLEEVHNHLRSSGVIFLFAADRQCVLAALADELPRGAEVPKRYLERMFSLDFEIPEPTQEQVFSLWKELVSGVEESPWAAWICKKTSEYENRAKQSRERAAAEPESTPDKQDAAREQALYTQFNSARLFLNCIGQYAIVRNPRRLKRIAVHLMTLLKTELGDNTERSDDIRKLFTISSAVFFVCLREIAYDVYDRFCRNPLTAPRAVIELQKLGELVLSGKEVNLTVDLKLSAIGQDMLERGVHLDPALAEFAMKSKGCITSASGYCADGLRAARLV